MRRKYVLIVLIFLLLSCNINQDYFKVTSDSMSPNLNAGDVVQIDKKNYILDYGDIVVCNLPFLDSDEVGPSIVRIVGLPGDSIRVVYDICEINGDKNISTLVKESAFIDDYIYNEYKETFPNGKIVHIFHRPDLETDQFVTAKSYIPDGHYFIMADNRSNSYDSRYFGSISADQILGKVIKVVPANE